MPQLPFRRLTPLLLLCAGLCLTSHAVSAKTLTLRGDLWCPFNCDPASAKPGYVIEIAREIFAKAGISVDYQLMPWKRVVTSVQDGSIDAAVGTSQHEIPGSIVPTQRLGVFRATIALRADNPFHFRNAESLAQLKLGVVIDYDYDDGGTIDHYVQEHLALNDGKVEAVFGENAQMQNLRKLINGRIDAVMDDREVLKFAAAQAMPHPDLRFETVGTSTDQFIVFSALNRQSPRYAKILSDGIVEMRRNGRIAEILARYGLDRNAF